MLILLFCFICYNKLSFKPESAHIYSVCSFSAILSPNLLPLHRVEIRYFESVYSITDKTNFLYVVHTCLWKLKQPLFIYNILQAYYWIMLHNTAPKTEAYIAAMDEWTIKTPNPICRLFFKIDLLTDFAALWLTDFIDLRFIHSWLVFSTQPVNCCPTDEGTIQYLCTVSSLHSLWPPPSPN